MAISKMATASPAIKSPQPNKEKNFRAACTHDRSNRFAPSSVIIVKKSARAVIHGGIEPVHEHAPDASRYGFPYAGQRGADGIADSADEV